MWVLPTRHPATGPSRINPSWPDEVVCGHDLPPVATFHPGVGEPIAMLEFTIRAPPSYDQPSRHYGRRRPIAVHDHRVVARYHHRVRARHDRIEYRRPIHRLIVFRIHKSVGEQSVK